jgi:hypothetical protein
MAMPVADRDAALKKKEEFHLPRPVVCAPSALPAEVRRRIGQVDVLVEQRFLRKKYTDPVTRSGEFEILFQGSLAQRQAASAAGRGSTFPGQQAGAGRGGSQSQLAPAPGSPFGSQAAGPQGGVVGVASKSKQKSLRVLDGRSVYNEWQFIFVPSQVTRTGPAGSVGPGGRAGQPGTTQPGMQRGRGPGGPGSPFSQPPIR